MALRTPDVKVAAITVVAGNVPLEQATRNALYTAELCGSSVPVYAGAARPSLREPSTRSGSTAATASAIKAIRRRNEARRASTPSTRSIDVISANPGIVLVTLGPLTNVALAWRDRRTSFENVSRCVIMGGNPCSEGNVTPAAEFNIWVDPEAARTVLRSGLPIELIGWHLCRGEANLLAPDIEHVLYLETELARFAIDCNRVAMEANRGQTGEIGNCAARSHCDGGRARSIDSTRASSHYVEVETTVNSRAG